MKVVIEESPAFSVIAAGREFSAKNCMAEIPKFWTEYYARENGEFACGQYGVCYGMRPDGTFRYAIGNRGKSGGVRVIYYFHSEAYPAFLLTLFAKNERANLSTGEVNELGQLAKLLCRKYGAER